MKSFHWIDQKEVTTKRKLQQLGIGMALMVSAIVGFILFGFLFLLLAFVD